VAGRDSPDESSAQTMGAIVSTGAQPAGYEPVICSTSRLPEAPARRGMR